MRSHAFVGEQGVQKGAEHAPLWGPCVEDQRSGGVVSYLHYLGWPIRKFRTQLHRTGFKQRASEINDELGGYYGVEG
jgi:hypothetical protein